MPSKKSPSVAVIVAIIAVALIAIAIATFLLKPTEIVIQSDDGNAVLEIPRGALPEGVSESDVSIKAISGELQTDLAEGDDASMLAYELLPDDLELKEPATIIIKGKRIEDATTIMVHASDDGLEPFENARKELDPDDATVSYVGELTHFSRAYVFSYRMFGMVMEQQIDHMVGVPFIVRVRIQQLGTEYDFTTGRGEEQHFELVEDEPLLLSDGLFTATGPISPSEAVLPGEEQEIDKTRHIIDQEFVCEDVGPVEMSYEANLKWTVEMEIEKRGRLKIGSSFRDQFNHMYVAPWADNFFSYEQEAGTYRFPREVSLTFNCIPAPDLTQFEQVDPGGIIIDQQSGTVEFTPFE